MEVQSHESRHRKAAFYMAGGTIITARIEDQGLIDRLKRAGDEARNRAKPFVREASLAGVNAIKGEMPIDEGRARASWGMWTPGDLRGDVEDAKQGDAIFTVSGDGMTVIQGTNVPYVEELNNGSSNQAPAGFIDRVAERMGDALMRKVAEMLDGVI